MTKKKRHVRVPVAYTSYRLETQADMKPLGQCNYGKKKIKISRTLKDYGQWSNAFWHEWFHAVAFELGYEKVADNEALVEAFAQAMMRFFTDPQGRLLMQGFLDHVEPK